MSVVSRSINYMVNRLLEGDRERERERESVSVIPVITRRTQDDFLGPRCFAALVLPHVPKANPLFPR